MIRQTSLATISRCESGGENDARQGCHTIESLEPHVFLGICERIHSIKCGLCSEMHGVCVGILIALATSDWILDYAHLADAATAALRPRACLHSITASPGLPCQAPASHLTLIISGLPKNLSVDRN